MGWPGNRGVLEASKSRTARQLFRVTRRQDNRLADPVVEEHSIGQTGQKVVLGRMSHLQVIAGRSRR